MEVKEHFLKFRENDTELEHIQQKKAEVGIRSMAAYLRKMALKDICIQMNLGDEPTEIRSLLSHCSSNLNQYAEDIKKLQQLMT